MIQAAASDEKVRAYVEEHFEQLLDEEFAKYSALIQFLPHAELKEQLLRQKALLPVLYRLLEPQAIQRWSPAIDSFFNLNVGVLCLSEVRDSILMWGHYTENHRGFVVGFDPDHPFFSKRSSEDDDFGFLRWVNYQPQRPQVMLSDTTSIAWFQTKSTDWAYEKEWRIVRVLSEAEHRIDAKPFPFCLFEFAADAVCEIIVGMRSAPSLVREIQSLAARFPKAAVLKAREDPSRYRLIVDKFGNS